MVNGKPANKGDNTPPTSAMPTRATKIKPPQQEEGEPFSLEKLKSKIWQETVENSKATE